jgi:hypothetical protein
MMELQLSAQIRWRRGTLRPVLCTSAEEQSGAASALTGVVAYGVCAVRHGTAAVQHHILIVPAGSFFSPPQTMGGATFVNFDSVEVKVDEASKPRERVKSSRKKPGLPLTAEEEKEREVRAEKYKRGRDISDDVIESVLDKKVKRSLTRYENLSRSARSKAAMAEILLETEGG